MYVKSLRVDGFWGKMTAQATLSPGVNAFIGPNGSGKTTLMNIIYAVLAADANLLQRLSFDKVSISLAGAPSVPQANELPMELPEQVLTAEKKRHDEDPSEEFVEYKLGDEQLALMELERVHRRRDRWRRLEASIPSRQPSALRVLKRELANRVDVRWLSVLSYAGADTELEWPSRFDSPADAKLTELQQQLNAYQLRLKGRESEISRKFQRDTFHMNLYDPELDRIPRPADILSADLGSLEPLLRRAFEEVGMTDEIIAEDLKRHMTALGQAIDLVQKIVNKKGVPRERWDDVLAFPLLQRSRRMAELVSEVEDKKKVVVQKRERFCTMVNSFLRGKSMAFGEDGALTVRLDPSKETIDLLQLSSGEKQLLIHLIEALTHEGQPCILIADEPEVSMHVEWQENLLRSMMELNPEAQIIVATHSPDIVADFGEETKDMCEVLSLG